MAGASLDAKLSERKDGGASLEWYDHGRWRLVRALLPGSKSCLACCSWSSFALSSVARMTFHADASMFSLAPADRERLTSAAVRGFAPAKLSAASGAVMGAGPARKRLLATPAGGFRLRTLADACRRMAVGWRCQSMVGVCGKCLLQRGPTWGP